MNHRHKLFLFVAPVIYLCLTACSRTPESEPSHVTAPTDAGVVLDAADIDLLLRSVNSVGDQDSVEQLVGAYPWIEPQAGTDGDLLGDIIGAQEISSTDLARHGLRVIAIARGSKDDEIKDLFNPGPDLEYGSVYISAASVAVLRQRDPVLLEDPRIDTGEQSEWILSGVLHVGGRTRMWGWSWMPVSVIAGPSGTPWLRVEYGGGAGTGLSIHWEEYFDLRLDGPELSSAVFHVTTQWIDANTPWHSSSRTYGKIRFFEIDGEPAISLVRERRLFAGVELKAGQIPDWFLEYAEQWETPDGLSLDPVYPILCISKIGLEVYRQDSDGTFRIDPEKSDFQAAEAEGWSRTILDPETCR